MKKVFQLSGVIQSRTTDMYLDHSCFKTPSPGYMNTTFVYLGSDSKFLSNFREFQYYRLSKQNISVEFQLIKPQISFGTRRPWRLPMQRDRGMVKWYSNLKEYLAFAPLSMRSPSDPQICHTSNLARFELSHMALEFSSPGGPRDQAVTSIEGSTDETTKRVGQSTLLRCACSIRRNFLLTPTYNQIHLWGSNLMLTTRVAT